jgi:hypothetical protein
MWSKEFLSKCASVLFTESSDAKLKTYYEEYLRDIQRPLWKSELMSLSNVVHFRDFVEDILKKTNTSRLVSAIKSTNDQEKRADYAVAFLYEELLLQNYTLKDLKFVDFAIQKELKSFYELARSITRFRPLLKNKRDALEAILSKMIKEPTIAEFSEYAKELGHSNIWPVLALYDSHMKGEAEETFLHCPMPRIFGSPSVIRNAIERTTQPSKLIRPNESAKSLDIKHVVVGSSNYISYNTSKGFQVFPASAELMASMPGVPDSIWTVCPATMHAIMYKLEDTGPKTLLEFDLDRGENINWIDCQRDADNGLVLSWGHINSLTGSLQERFCVAFDDWTNEFKTEMAEVPGRTALGSRVDYRDHGNLMSIHHTVTDDDESKDRKWTHTYEICFGNYLLMTLSTDSRPINSIYGAAHDFMLLSPLSATQSIQQWFFDGNKYAQYTSFSVPKVPKGEWASICVPYK